MPNGDRLIIHRIEPAEGINVPDDMIGIWITSHGHPLMRTACGRVGRIMASTYEGGKKGHGNDKLVRLVTAAQAERATLKKV
jgi:methionyl-tRNA formyltransferase